MIPFLCKWCKCGVNWDAAKLLSFGWKQKDLVSVMGPAILM